MSVLTPASSPTVHACVDGLVEADGRTPAATTAGPGVRPGHRSLMQRLFKPGWPLAAMIVPFPLWWALGLTEWIVPVMVLPMLWHLLRTRTVLVPRGFGWWMAFLLWVCAGGFLLQVDALGAVADDSSTRLITFGYRLGWYLAITIVLLYVINTKRELGTTRVVRIVATLFITVTLGGLLGVVAPYFTFPSLVELLLPHALTKFQLIHNMVHPQAAQLQVVLGYTSPRPSAPYTYTNTWGLNYAVTLPFFLLAWTGKDAGWRRWAAGPILLVAAVPGIYSIDRGMWGAVVVMAVFVAVRAALIGKPGVLLGLVAAAVGLALLVALSPLGTIVALRFSNEGSEQGRTNLGTLALKSVTATSPVVGLGSSRNVQGNFQSITGGSTAQCPRCSPPSLGTQGQLWLVVFSQGLIGFLLFALFFVVVFLRHIRLRSPTVTLGLATIVGWTITLVVYNSLGSGMLVVMVAVALLCREGSPAAGRLVGRDDPSLTPLGHYTAALRGGVPVLVVGAVVGGALGWTWLALHPTPYVATQSVVLPQPPRYPSPGYARTNVDTDAQLVSSSAVRSAAAQASGESETEVADALTVTATPNTGVLHLHLSAPTASAASAGVTAATDAFLSMRGKRLESDRGVELGRLRLQAATTERGIDQSDALIQQAKVRDTLGGSTSTDVVRNHRNELLATANQIASQTARIHSLVLSGGHRTAPVVVTRTGDRIRVDLVSGATLGLAAAGLLLVAHGAAGPRLRRVRDIRTATDVPLLAVSPVTPLGVHSMTSLLAERPLTYVAVSEDDEAAATLAHRLADDAPRRTRAAEAVVVASSRTRVDEVVACSRGLRRQGIPVRGLVLSATGRNADAGGVTDVS